MSLLEIMIATGLAVVAFLLGRASLRSTVHGLRGSLHQCRHWLGHDPLTGLLNRVGLYGTFTCWAARGDQAIAALLIDLDKFKEVNDTHGHAAGDALLIEIAARLGGVVEVCGGVAARLSGDEFVVLLPIRDTPTGAITNQLVRRIAQPAELDVDGDIIRVQVTASIGATVGFTSERLDTTILRQADIAMYEAKRRGGNQYAFHEAGSAMPANHARRGTRLRDRSNQAGDVT